MKDTDNLSENTVFWTRGNYPAQVIHQLQLSEIEYHLRLLYLLSDNILAAGSFYFESDLTRNITEKLKELFGHTGDVSFFIDNDIENFEEHGCKKSEKSPASLIAYRDLSKVRERGKSLDSFCNLTRRPPISISDKIVELWIEELNSNLPETLGGEIAVRITDRASQENIKTSLSEFAKNRTKDFVWEYLQPKLSELGLCKSFQFWMRKKLSDLYSIATSVVLGIPMDANISWHRSFISEKSKYDTYLFSECIKALNLNNAIVELPTVDIIALKYSQEFLYFKEFYFKLIEAASLNINFMRKILIHASSVEKITCSGKYSRARFIKSFSTLCKYSDIPKASYKDPLDYILHVYDSINRVVINTFVEFVQDLNKEKGRELKAMGRADRINAPLKHYSSAQDFVSNNMQEIKDIIINKWRIPRTKTPGNYEQKVMHIEAWLENFSVTEYELVYELIRHIKYYNNTDIDKMLKKMSDEIKGIFNNLADIAFCPLGTCSSSSGSQFIYRLSKHLELQSRNFLNSTQLDDKLDRSYRAIVFIDDVIGSGKQATRYCERHLKGLGIDKYYYSLVAFENGLKNLEKNSTFDMVFSVTVLTEAEKVFSDSSVILPDPTVRNRIREIAQEYGEKLYPMGPLGYEDSQALIAFSYNTPNNTLPIIWASAKNEKVKGLTWNPLFERRKKT